MPPSPEEDVTGIPDQFGQDSGELSAPRFDVRSGHERVGVDLDDLRAKTVEYGWAYLLTVRDDARPHVVAVSPTWVDGALVASVGRGSASNAATRSSITLCYPPVDSAGFSLIVDGVATVDEEVVTLTPTAAVLHRPAP